MARSPDVNGFEREQIEMAKRLYHLCCLTYDGPDPLGLGTGWCVHSSAVMHNNHRDQFGREWVGEYRVRPTSVTITPLDYDARVPRDTDHKGHKRR
jgi:hypothetical protein